MSGRAELSLNGNLAASKETANLLLNNGMDVGAVRPYLVNTGSYAVPEMKAYIDRFAGYARNAEGKRIPQFRAIEIPVGNASLRKDEWIEFDEIVLKEARQRLRYVNMLIRRGLVKSVDGMAKMSLESENQNDMQAAELTMDGINRANKDTANFELVGTPLPIAHKEFDIPLRKLNASRNTGEPLDTTLIEMAVRQVAELIEDIHLNGSSTYTAANYAMYGVTDHPNINTGSLVKDWANSGASGTEVLQDVLNMLAAARADNMYGPFALLIPGNFEGVLDEDFKANSDKTIRQRLMEIDSIEEILVLDKLADSNVVLQQLTSDVMRTISGLPITTVQWDSVGGLGLNFKVMGIQVPQPRATQSGKSGIVLYT